MSSFGEALRRERELRGVSLQDISAATKIGVGMLKAIEEDRLDKLPQGLFVRGFVREYARFLALDEQKVLTELSFHTAPLPSPEPLPEKAESRISSRFTARLVNAGIIVGIFGGVAALILSPGWSSERTSPTESSATASKPPDSRGLASSTVLTAGANAEGALPGAVEKPSVLPQPLQLTLTATEDCWIGLDVGGDRVENRILKKGESFSISARQNASLAVGNAGGLLVAIDSGPARPLGNRGEVKRNIVLSPETLGALSAGTETASTKPIG